MREMMAFRSCQTTSMSVSWGAYFGSHSTVSQCARAASAARVALLVWIGPLSSTITTGLPGSPGLGPYRNRGFAAGRMCSTFICWPGELSMLFVCGRSVRRGCEYNSISAYMFLMQLVYLHAASNEVCRSDRFAAGHERQALRSIQSRRPGAHDGIWHLLKHGFGKGLVTQVGEMVLTDNEMINH